MKRLLFCLLSLGLLIGSALPFAQPVYAATATLRPTGVGTYTQCTIQGGAGTNWGSVDEAVADDATTAVYIHKLNGLAGDEVGIDSYTTDNFTAAYSAINSLTLYYRSIYACTGTCAWGEAYGKPVLVIGGVSYYGTLTQFTASWATYSYTWTTNPSTLLAWTASGINNAEIGVYLLARNLNASGVSAYSYDTQLYAVVDYTPPTVPAVTTNTAFPVACDNVTLNGSITDTGGATVDYYAFVWDTSSHGNPGNTEPPATYSDNWTSSLGDYDIDDYTHNVATLPSDTLYHTRFAAHNSEGWVYGDEIDFTTWDIPVIVTQDATDKTVSSARLQSYLDDMNGEACQVRWGYGKSDNGTDIEAYDVSTSYSGSYTTGTSPYLDISGLDAGDTYYFNVEAKNSCGSSTGTVKSFILEIEVGSPSNVIAIPDVDSITLSWVKGLGAPNTFVRFKKNACPVDETDGALIYLSTASTYTHEDLESGADYCYLVIGYDSVEGYSDNFTIIHATTLAAGIVPSGAGVAINKPAGGMTGMPSVSPSLVQKIPLLLFTQKDATSIGMEHAYFLYGLMILGLAGLSYFVYRHTHEVMIVVIIWLVASWIAYETLSAPLAVFVFVVLVGGGYGAYRMRSVI